MFNANFDAVYYTFILLAVAGALFEPEALDDSAPKSRGFLFRFILDLFTNKIIISIIFIR